MKLKYFFFLMFSAFSLSSCLNSDLEDLPEYSDALITNVSSVIHRYYDDSNKWVDGSSIVTEKALTKISSAIDKNALTVVANYKIPSADASGPYNDAQKAKVTITNIVVTFDISTAAIMTPLDGAPKPGVPGDWSVPRKYEIKAADGTKAIWTVTITLTP